MTYFEWVETFDKLETSPMDEKILKELETKTLEGGEHVMYRFIVHVIETVNRRLNKAFGIIIKKIIDRDFDTNTLELELITFKKEINFCKKITSIKIIPKNNQEAFDRSINNTIEDMYNLLYEHLEYIDIDGEYISILEKNRY